MKILAIDSNSIINRAFYGVRLLSNKNGVYTNAIFGFMNIILKVIQEVKPDGLAFAFDLSHPTFRHEIYTEYKAGRKKMPEELAMQFPLIKDLLTYLGYKIIEVPGYEADDILGSIAKLCLNTGDECVIVTGDKDSLQLVSDKTNVRLASTKGGNPIVTIYTPKEIMDIYGITPPELIQVKSLMGDKSDNIPGVAGIGEKTALDLIQKYKTLDYIYNNIDDLDIKPGVKSKLIKDKDSAFLSLKLGEIATDAPISTDTNDYIKSDGSPDKAIELLKSLEMYKILEKLDLSPNNQSENILENKPIQKELKVMTISSQKQLEDFLKNTKNKVFFNILFDQNIAVQISITDGNIILDSDISCLEFNIIIKYLLESNIDKVVHDSKSLYHYAFSNNLAINNIVFDTALAGYILNPLSKSYDLDRLADSYSSVSQNSDTDVNIQNINIIYDIYTKMKLELEDNNQEDLLYNIELPLSEVLASMEVIGFNIDTQGVYNFGQNLSIKLDELESQIYDLAGVNFNINSPKQLSEILFDKLELPTRKKNKSGFSTNAEVLESLKPYHPIINLILEYRQLSKLKSTYVDGLLKVVKDDGKIHTSFNQTETRTGRISSVEPNMQNIPVKTSIGREMRKFFKASDGKALVDADYSQIELRVLAHISNDENMIDAFANNIDIHTSTAARVFNMPIDMVTSGMRNNAKAVNFGIVYGISAFSLSNDIGVTVKEAKQYIEEYLNNYSGVKQYMKDTVEFGKENKYVETLFKRRRALPEISSSNHIQRSFGERVAMNMPIQGTAADIIKIAMIKVYNRLKKENMSSRLILQVHDELIIESPQNEVEKASAILKEEMENAVSLKVNLPVDVNSGETWYDAKK